MMFIAYIYLDIFLKKFNSIEKFEIYFLSYNFFMFYLLIYSEKD